jgi:hypothetical protein
MAKGLIQDKKLEVPKVSTTPKGPRIVSIVLILGFQTLILAMILLKIHQFRFYPDLTYYEYLKYRKGRFYYDLTHLRVKETVPEEIYPGLDRLARWRRFDTAAYISYSQLISSAAYQYGLDPDLIRAVILIESRFKERAVSPKGASGLMQLMPATAAELGVSNIFDNKQNINAGARYLAYLLNMFEGDLTLALAAYNAGPGAVKRHGGVPPYPETISYVKQVNEAYDILQGRKLP